MKGTFTFTDGASNQTNLTNTSNSEAKGNKFLFAKDLFRKAKQLFVQGEIIEPLINTVLLKKPIKAVQMQTMACEKASVEAAGPVVSTKNESHSSHINYQLNIQQMNLFTYLKRAILGSEQSLSGQFLEQFKIFLSVIVGAASDKNAPLAKRYFGILSNFGGFKLLCNKIFNQPALRWRASVMFLSLFTAFGTLAQTAPTVGTDLSVKNTITTQSPTVGQEVTYTIKVKNNGTIGATGVELTDILPAGVTLKTVSVAVGSTTNTTTAGVTTVIWNIGAVGAFPTELTMTIVATVVNRGLWFNTAEITKEIEVELNSTPNNHNINEDDQDAVCFSVAEYFYKGDEFKIGLPLGYTNINWTIKAGSGATVAITSTTPGVSLNSTKDTLTVFDITAYTEFAFTATNKSCPVGGCCPAKFIYGPLGSIGDYVFTDVNQDGIQNTGDTPLSGVKVQLYKADGITFIKEVTTDINGKYLFDSLQTDSYKVKFLLPSGKTFVTPNVGTSAEDSDAGVGGFSGLINIDVTKPSGDVGRNNLTIDAGVKTICNINPGTLATSMPNFCLPSGGSVVLTATVATAPTVPTGYSVKYVLTKGSDLVIQQTSNSPTFTVTTTGEYRIHTLVYDGNSANGNYLDLSTIVLGTTKGADLISNIAQRAICAALDATGVKFNVNGNPVAPTVSGATICAGSTVRLGKVSLGTTAKWYTSAIATVPFKIDSTITISPTITTTYYVSVTSIEGCESLRTPVTVTVNPKPENPVAKSSLANDCTKNLQTVNLADAITTIPSGSIIEWHVANDVTSAIITNTTAVGAGTYYVFAKSTAGCYSGGVPVTVTINSCTCQNPATVSVAPIAAVCGNTSSIIQLGATIGGGATSGTWTSNGKGTFDNATSLTAKYTPSAADLTAGSVEFTFTTNDPDGADPKCIAASAKNILTLKAKPLPPTSLRCEQVICLGESNKLFSVSQGNTVKWYATATSTTPLGTATDDGFVVTPTAEGFFTYYAEATTPEGCVSERSSISFTVKKCLTDLVVIKKAYTPDAITTPDYLLGQSATYSIEAQNIGDANATDVKVNDILPVGATYVSSIPTGEYNSATGIWTIGSLTKGSNKSLLIQVTLGKTGSIVNTATISGTNEDPTKLANNTSTVTIKVVEIADLSLTKTVSKSVANIGDEIEYTITVLNSGPNTATNVEVKDKLPLGLTYVSSSTLTESAGVLTGTAASIAKGATAVFTFKAKVASAGKITNFSEVSKSDQKDPDSTPSNGSTKPDEDDDDSVDINSTVVCNLEKPIIACGCTQKTICLGGEITLTATGCVGSTFVWSNGGSTSSITVSPKTNQTYVVYCQKDNCKSESSNAVEVKVITVDSPLLSASPSKICVGESTTLTAKGCGGVVEWQTSPKQTGPQITVTPTVSETYKAICKQFDCVSPLASVDVIVTPIPKAPIIVCEKGEICPGETISLTAMNCNGQVKWSTGQETTTITVFPTITSTYTATCSVNGCTSAASTPFLLTVKPIAIPTIKTTDLIICTGGTATLTAEGCTGKVTWYYGDKTLTGATIIVKPTTTTTYYATCSSIACTSEKSAPVTIQLANPTPPVVSSGTSTICAGSSVELSATGCDGIVTWSDGQKGVVVTVKPLVSTSYTATCSIGTCVSESSLKRNITVTDFAKPTITADKLSICAGNSVTLTANGCNGTVKWSDGVTGSPRTVTPTADVKYTATCESTTCKSDVSNELAIKVNTAGSAPVISSTKTEICAGESIIFSATGCTGTVKWSDGSTGTTVTLKPSVTTTYSATCTVSTCESPKSNEKTIKVNPAVVLKLVASASSPQICAGTETTLTLVGCTGTITWTGGLTGSSIKVKPTETTTYTATCTGVACATDASASVKVNVSPAATTPNITSTNTQICAGEEVILSANNCNGTLSWSNGATTASITVRPVATTIYSVKCTVDGCGEAKTSEPVTVKVGTPDAPTVTPGTSIVCAGGSVVLTAVGCTSGTVVWSNGKTGTTLTETVNATTTYSAICKQGTCNSRESNKIIVTVTVPSVPTISCATSTICPGSSVTLYASGCEGTVKWSDGQTGAIVTVTPTKTTDYTATCTIGTCVSSPSSVATVNVGNPPAPSITCSAASICQGIQVTLTATNCTGTIVWNDGQVGNVITAKPNATTTYTAICKLDKCESGKSNPVTVTVGAGIRTPTTKNLNNVCPFLTVDLASGVTSSLSAGGVFEFHTGVLPTSPLVSNPNAVGTGTYYVFEKTGTGCYSSPGVISTFINTDCTPKDCAKTPATVSAGADATICAEKTYQLSGTFGGSATSIVWKTTGTGSFDNPLSPTATYRSSLADVLAGTVKLIICTNDPDGNGPCLAKADTMVLTMNGVKFKPLIAVTGKLNACGTDSVNLTANAGNYAYLWFKVGTIAPIATTRSIVVKNSGEYFFKLVDPDKCCSIESDTAKVNYLSIPNAPIANSVKIDNGTTVDLNKLVVSNLPSGATLIFKTGASSSSTMVANPSAVGAGIYYACYKNAQGCFSLSTKITVENKNIGSTPADADIQIAVTTENNIALDSTVKVTITVKNNGPAVGKNVAVLAPVPTGLTFVSSTGGLVKSGNLLNGAMDSLISGGVKVYTWVGKITASTTSVTVAATGTSNNLDPNPNNNNASNPNGSVVVAAPPANSADIIVTITTDKINYMAGDTVTTTMKVTNLGPVTAKNVSVSSTVPDKLAYVSQSGGLVIDGKVLTGKLDSIVKNDTKTYIFKSVLSVSEPLLIKGIGTSNNPDPNPSNNNGTSINGSIMINPAVASVADVGITITTNKSTYAVGDTVTTTVKVTNFGPDAAKSINVFSIIPGTLTYVSQTGGLVKNGNLLSATIASLDKDGIVTYTYKSVLNTKSETVVAAGGTSTTKDPNPNNNNGTGATGTSTINKGDIDPTVADVAIVITADRTKAKAGEDVNFILTLTNNGPATAKKVLLLNPIPTGMTFVSSSTGQVLTNGAILVSLDSLPKGQVRTYSYVAKMNVITNVINTVSVGSLKDNVGPNNFSFVTINGDTTGTVVEKNEGDLALLITANKQLIALNDAVTFTIKVTNKGPKVATNVVVDNILPKFLTFQSGDPSQIGDTLRVVTASIPVGSTVTYTYTAKVNKDTIIRNTAKITKTSPTDPILTNNVSTVVLVPSVCNINLAMAITDTAKVSDGVYNVTYRLIAKNMCKDTLKNVTLFNDLAKTFKTPVTYDIIGKPSTGIKTNLIPNDLFSKTDSSMVKVGSYMLPNAIDTIKYVVKVTLNGNKGPFVSNVTTAGKSTGNENLTAKAKETLRFDLLNTRIGLAKEIVTTALKNDSTTYWTVPYRIRVVNMGINAITKLSVKDSIDAVFTAKGAVIVGTPIIIATPGLTVNKKYTGKGLFTDLLVPDSSSLAKGDTAIIDLTVSVNVAGAPDAEKIFNNVAVGTGTGTDQLIYKDISTNGNNPDTNGDKDPSNDNVATPVQLKGNVVAQQVAIGLALAAITDTIPLADSTCNVTLIMTAKNYGKDNLRNVRLCTNIQNTIGKESLSWTLIGTPRVIRGNAKIDSKFNGISDSTITKSDSTFLAVGDSIIIAYMVNIKGALKDTIYTQAIAKARSAVDTTKLTSDISMNGLRPDSNGDGNPSEAAPTPIICKTALVLTTAFIPDGFSPNGDGINDAFKIQGMKSTELNELIIFNRWGGVVYASPDYQNDWTGQANQGVVAIGAGQGLPDGTYFYSFSRYAKGANGEKGDKVAPDRIKSITLIR